MKLKKKYVIKQFLLWLSLLVNALCMHAQPHVIFDTDMGSDCDDAGALAVLHKLADKGEVKILGVMFSSCKNKYGVGVCDAINTYYGRGDLPLGQYKGDDVGDPHNTYSMEIATSVNKYHHDVVDSAQEIVAAYKELLKKQPDKSVTIITVGHPNGLFSLIQDKSGLALVKQKVSKWVAMAYADTLPKRDWNFGKNGAETCIVDLLKQWPKPLYISGFGKAKTGNKKLPATPETNPVKQAYRLWKNSLAEGRNSPDQIAVLFAVRPQYFIIENDGSIQRNSNIETFWDTHIKDEKQHRVIPILENTKLEEIIEDLMSEPPLLVNKN